MFAECPQNFYHKTIKIHDPPSNSYCFTRDITYLHVIHYQRKPDEIEVALRIIIEIKTFEIDLELVC